MTLSDLEWPFHASRAISAVVELLVLNITILWHLKQSY